MKRIGIALSIILTLALLSLWHTACLRRLTEELTDLLTRAEEQVEQDDWLAADALTRRALAAWEGHDFYLHAVLRHEDADAILTGFHQTLAYLEGDEPQPSEYAAANAQLITLVRLLLEEETPTLKNIL